MWKRNQINNIFRTNNHESISHQPINLLIRMQFLHEQKKNRIIINDQIDRMLANKFLYFALAIINKILCTQSIPLLMLTQKWLFRSECIRKSNSQIKGFNALVRRYIIIKWMIKAKFLEYRKIFYYQEAFIGSFTERQRWAFNIKTLVLDYSWKNFKWLAYASWFILKKILR